MGATPALKSVNAAFARHVLDREIKTLDTPEGPVRIKESKGYGVTRAKLEHDDLARIAKEKGVSLAEAEKLAGKA